MKIGILGLALSSKGYKGGNLGCYALSLSFFEVLNRIAVKNQININVIYICTFPPSILIKKYIKKTLGLNNDSFMNYYTSMFSNLSFSRGYYYKYNNNNVFLSGSIKKCSLVFDFTAGDSFSDIYGEDRFFERSLIKEVIINNNIPLVLGSQTIGPFKDKKVLDKAISILKSSKEVFARDSESQKYVLNICGRSPVLTTDIAFFLPYNKYESHNNKSIGFNPSGLLWSGGYNRNNQFALTVDYRNYCINVISYLLHIGYEVHLIMHAFYIDNDNYPDNDYIAVKALHNIFPSTIIAPEFDSPIEVKNYISQMDIFIGARMHATIGALSAKIPVIPFSYSRKFEGLYDSLQYKYVIHGTKYETNYAVSETLKWVENKNELLNAVELSHNIINKKNDELLSSYESIILNV